MILSEAYLIDFLQIPIERCGGELLPVHDIKALMDPLLLAKGLPVHRLEEIHIFGGSQSPRTAGLGNQTAWFQWPSGGLLPHFVLNACCRSIEAGEVDLAVLIEETQSGYTLLVLGSPKAVGKYNLPPRARLGPYRFVPDGETSVFSVVREFVQTSGMDPNEVQRIAAPGLQAQEDLDTNFPYARLLLDNFHKDETSFSILSTLVSQLETDRLRLGLLCSKHTRQPSLVTLVERL